MSKEEKFNRVMDISFIRDGKLIHHGEAVLLACLVHSKGASRNSQDMVEVQRLLKDKNLDTK